MTNEIHTCRNCAGLPECLLRDRDELEDPCSNCKIFNEAEVGVLDYCPFLMWGDDCMKTFGPDCPSWKAMPVDGIYEDDETDREVLIELQKTINEIHEKALKKKQEGGGLKCQKS